MKLGHLEHIVPNRQACFDLLDLVESEYNVSIKFWLDANNTRGGEIGWSVYCVGSGGIWDYLDGAGTVGKARILDADGGNIYPAIWSALLQLESHFHRMKIADTRMTVPFEL